MYPAGVSHKQGAHLYAFNRRDVSHQYIMLRLGLAKSKWMYSLGRLNKFLIVF